MFLSKILVATTVFLNGLTVLDAVMHMHCTSKSGDPTSTAETCQAESKRITEKMMECVVNHSEGAIVTGEMVEMEEHHMLRGTTRKLGDPCDVDPDTLSLGSQMACCLVGDYSYCSGGGTRRLLSTNTFDMDEAELQDKDLLATISTVCTHELATMAREAETHHDCFGSPETVLCEFSLA